ncbi:MAG: hypothetical protein PHS59_15870 [Paludibacter sp.]|nr:hypothetical protein [Paludibacter sp.]
MYDNVDFKVRGIEVGGIDFLSQTPLYFDVTGEHCFNGENVITGNLNGLRVSTSQRGVNITDGSLCKWYLGDNFKTLERGDIQRAIEKLSDTLHLPIDKANVTRIDLAQNFIMKHPTEVYFNHLGSNYPSKRLEQPDGLYYSKHDTLLVFYDKVKEQRAKGQAIPELYSNRNTLRYEMRHKARLKDTFKVDRVTGAMLYEEQFYMDIVKRWKKAYKDIKKINDVTLNFKAMAGKKDLYTLALASLIEQQGGELAMIQQINELFKKGQIKKKQSYDLRQAIKEASRASIATVESDVIKELDKKIDDVVRFYR